MNLDILNLRNLRCQNEASEQQYIKFLITAWKGQLIPSFCVRWARHQDVSYIRSCTTKDPAEQTDNVSTAEQRAQSKIYELQQFIALRNFILRNRVGNRIGLFPLILLKNQGNHEKYKLGLLNWYFNTNT